jgi:tetratricopeptide (TPR) repeat protein
MKNRLFILIVAVVVFVFTATGRPAENYATQNPAGSGTVPMSSLYNSLMGTPNPIDTSGNLVITGNVRRGGHFRAAVPYESTTNFRAGLGSSSLSSFLRDSAGPEDFGRYTGGYGVQPYYLQSGTVATTRPGYSGVFRPSDTSSNNSTLPGINFIGTSGTTSTQQTFPGWNTYTQPDNVQESFETALQGMNEFAQRPKIVNSLRELLMLTRSQETSLTPQDQRLKTEDQKPKAPDLILQMQDARLQAAQDTKPQSRRQQEPADDKQDVYDWVVLPEQAEPLQSDSSLEQKEKAEAERRNVPPMYQMNSFLSDSARKRNDVMEQLRQQIDTLRRTIEARIKAEVEESGRKGLTGMEAYEDYRRAAGFDKTESGDINESGKGDFEFLRTQSEDYRSRIFSLEELNKFSKAKISSMAKEIRGELSPESFAQTKFEQHVRAAENYLKAGRYYRAADSYSLASIYKMSDPSCLAGRAHALFAAGEYVSSALFLSRALELAPEYIYTNVDLVTMLGGVERFETKLANARRWLSENDSGKLQFLLAYVYYRTGRLQQAKRAIAVASQKMPDSMAVEIVRKAIAMR